MRRREFITFLGGAAMSATLWPLDARAQPGVMRRIGALMGYPENDPEGQAFFAAFREGLQKLGWSPDDAQARQRFAKELVALQPELILSQSTAPTAALLQQTRIIPIIFTNVTDPVGSGFIASLPRPGGNELCAEVGDGMKG